MCYVEPSSWLSIVPLPGRRPKAACGVATRSASPGLAPAAAHVIWRLSGNRGRVGDRPITRADYQVSAGLVCRSDQELLSRSTVSKDPITGSPLLLLVITATAHAL
jgi:hypothetical protein